MMTPLRQDEKGLRYAKKVVEYLITVNTNPNPAAQSWEEGWKLGMEEILHKINWDLDYLGHSNATRRSAQ